MAISKKALLALIFSGASIIGPILTSSYIPLPKISSNWSVLIAEFYSIYFYLPLLGIVGLVFGILAFKENRKIAILAIILSAVSIIFVIFWIYVFLTVSWNGN